MNLVSIIIPVLNRAHLLGATLDSVKSQTYQNWECIIVDDQSKDYTRELVEFYTEKDNRFRFFTRPENSNRGASSCRNYGIKISEGEFIQFLDSDDLISEEKIEVQVNLLKSDDRISFVTCRWGRFYSKVEDAEIYWNLSSYSDYNSSFDFLNSLAKSLGFFPIHAYLIRRDIINQAGLWNEYLSLNDDAEFIVRIVVIAQRIGFVAEGIVFYRWPSKNNQSVYKSEAQVLDALYSWMAIEAYLKVRYKGKEISYLEKGKMEFYKHIQSFPGVLDKHNSFFGNQVGNRKISSLLRIIKKWYKEQ